MPTSSERLIARSNAYMEAATSLEVLAERTNDALESEEYERLSEKLWAECTRISGLALKRREKEKNLEHRRKIT